MTPPMNGYDGMMSGNEMPYDGSMGNQFDNGGASQFDTNFDAGVEADENTDPKKYIQQLTGKLSQSLRSYNETLPQPDADLDKYVAGMIVKQAIEGLSQEDTDDILNKIKNNETPDDSVDGQEPPMDGNMPNQGAGANGMGESRHRGISNIDEIFNQVMDNTDDDNELQQPIEDISYKKKPFTSPRFK